MAQKVDEHGTLFGRAERYRSALDSSLERAEIAYSVFVFNHGPKAADGLVVTDTLPAGVTYLGASAPGATCVHDSGVVTCTFDEPLPSAALRRSTCASRHRSRPAH